MDRLKGRGRRTKVQMGQQQSHQLPVYALFRFRWRVWVPRSGRSSGAAEKTENQNGGKAVGVSGNCLELFLWQTFYLLAN